MLILVNILGRPEELMNLEVEASDSLDCVRAKIQWEKSIPPDHQKLFHEGTLLEDGSRPISEYNIRHYSYLRLAIKRPGDLSTHVGCFCLPTVAVGVPGVGSIRDCDEDLP